MGITWIIINAQNHVKGANIATMLHTIVYRSYIRVHSFGADWSSGWRLTH